MKCCQNGELSGRRRTLSAMRFPHPLPIMDDLLYDATILGRVRFGQFCAALSPDETPYAYGMGLFCFIPWGSHKLTDRALIKRRLFYG